ncbi:putative immunity protein [Rhodococcus qingshengii]|uniref:putative immunity protein n=1 Tax=Rhodococcus qingshengii TaxID=334542 RepID=UPI003601A595
MTSDPASAEVSDADRRSLALWAADCAERALPLFESASPDDDRVRRAIDGARAFGMDGNCTRGLRALCWAAHACVHSVAAEPARSAARAAAHAVAIPHLGTAENPSEAKQILSPALYAAYALELAAANGPAVGDAEIRWAIGRASPAVGDVLRRTPVPKLGCSRVDIMLRTLEIGLRR